MFKQADALIVLLVTASVIGILLLSGDIASIVAIAAFAAVAGALAGFRISRTHASAASSLDAERFASGPSGAGNRPRFRAPVAASPKSIDDTATGQATPEHSNPATSLSAGESRSHAADGLDHVARRAFEASMDGIAVKDLAGTYRYVNAAFAAFAGQPGTQMTGKRDDDLFDLACASELERQDADTLSNGPTWAVIEIPAPGENRIFEIGKAALTDAEGTPDAIVSIWHNVTETTKARQRRDKAMYRTIVALTGGIGFVDKHLAEHAHHVSRTAAAVAEALGLDADTIMTVELAGFLSQLGKLGVDRRLLHKQGLLSEAERKIIEQHVQHTARLVRELDFGLPVAQTLYQAHERLDGNGYPLGLQDEEIRLTARILGASDVFCARIETRSYRSAISPEQALTILEQNPQRYDAQVVAALRQVVESRGDGWMSPGRQPDPSRDSNAGMLHVDRP